MSLWRPTAVPAPVPPLLTQHVLLLVALRARIAAAFASLPRDLHPDLLTLDLEEIGYLESKRIYALLLESNTDSRNIFGRLTGSAVGYHHLPACLSASSLSPAPARSSTRRSPPARHPGDLRHGIKARGGSALFAPGRDCLRIPAGADHSPAWSLLVGVRDGAALRLSRLRVARSGRILGRSDDAPDFFHQIEMSPTGRQRRPRRPRRQRAVLLFPGDHRAMNDKLSSIAFFS